MQYSITLISLLALVSAEKPRFTRFFNIVFENTDLVVASELSYFKELASKGRLYANMHGVAHPSQPNYIAMVAGTTFGFLSDDNIDIPGSNLADLLEARHLTWKTYQENYPGNCYIGKGLNDLYERKHNPFMSFDNIRNNATRCANIVNEQQLNMDIASGSVPNYVMYIPNQIHDGHSIPPWVTPTKETTEERIEVGSVWLSNFLPPLLANPYFKDTLFFITFDENDAVSRKWDDAMSIQNLIYSVAIGAGVQAGSIDHNEYTHYSQLALLEQEWNLPSLGRNDTTANALLLSGSIALPTKTSSMYYASTTASSYSTPAVVTSTYVKATNAPAGYSSAKGPVSTAAIYSSAESESISALFWGLLLIL